MSGVPIVDQDNYTYADTPVLARRVVLVDAAGAVYTATSAGTATSNVLVTNTTGSSAVNIQDGGNTITVDGTVSIGSGSAAIGKFIRSNVLVPADFDYVSLSYTGDNLTGVVFKTGGSGGTTVATLTLVYTGARLDTVTKT